MVPVIPPAGTLVAAIVPDPLVVREAPVPMTNAAEVLVELVIPEKGTLVAVIVPEPLVVREAPVPTTIPAEVLVPLVIALKVGAEPVFVMVWFGKLPVMLIPVPATKAGDEVPVPPFAIGTMVEEASEVATMVPVPLVAKEAPVPTNIAAEVLVPEVIPEKGTVGVKPTIVAPVKVTVVPDPKVVLPLKDDKPLNTLRSYAPRWLMA